MRSLTDLSGAPVSIIGPIRVRCSCNHSTLNLSNATCHRCQKAASSATESMVPITSYSTSNTERKKRKARGDKPLATFQMIRHTSNKSRKRIWELRN
ncbi:hypothetical protein NPIL_332951 [Nephila pilipes]|uniref:Uncharacterized protein n=1 Tax=Nephila pilipes TaxID=299642 RepID=A0A8X6U1D4_NEPPI|nr:hypothetical protein NPIL_332951 [Nephila pilipes]